MKLKLFKPNAEVNIACNDHGEFFTARVIAHIVSRTGNQIAITQLEGETKGVIVYGLTHVASGMSLTGKHTTIDIEKLEKRARMIWRELNKEQKELFCSSSFEKIRKGLPEATIREIVRIGAGQYDN